MWVFLCESNREMSTGHSILGPGKELRHFADVIQVRFRQNTLNFLEDTHNGYTIVRPWGPYLIRTLALYVMSCYKWPCYMRHYWWHVYLFIPQIPSSFIAYLHVFSSKHTYPSPAFRATRWTQNSQEQCWCVQLRYSVSDPCTCVTVSYLHPVSVFTFCIPTQCLAQTSVCIPTECLYFYAVSVSPPNVCLHPI